MRVLTMRGPHTTHLCGLGARERGATSSARQLRSWTATHSLPAQPTFAALAHLCAVRSTMGCELASSNAIVSRHVSRHASPAAASLVGSSWEEANRRRQLAWLVLHAPPQQSPHGRMDHSVRGVLTSRIAAPLLGPHLLHALPVADLPPLLVPLRGGQWGTGAGRLHWDAQVRQLQLGTPTP